MAQCIVAARDLPHRFHIATIYHHRVWLYASRDAAGVTLYDANGARVLRLSPEQRVVIEVDTAGAQRIQGHD